MAANDPVDRVCYSSDNGLCTKDLYFMYLNITINSQTTPQLTLQTYRTWFATHTQNTFESVTTYCSLIGYCTYLFANTSATYQSIFAVLVFCTHAATDSTRIGVSWITVSLWQRTISQLVNSSHNITSSKLKISCNLIKQNIQASQWSRVMVIKLCEIQAYASLHCAKHHSCN